MELKKILDDETFNIYQELNAGNQMLVSGHVYTILEKNVMPYMITFKLKDFEERTLAFTCVHEQSLERT